MVSLHSLGDLELEAEEIGRPADAYREAIGRAHALDAFAHWIATEARA